MKSIVLTYCCESPSTAVTVRFVCSTADVTTFHINSAFHLAFHVANQQVKIADIPYLQVYTGSQDEFDAQFPV